jgi:hypothetical protein
MSQAHYSLRIVITLIFVLFHVDNDAGFHLRVSIDFEFRFLETWEDLGKPLLCPQRLRPLKHRYLRCCHI